MSDCPDCGRPLELHSRHIRLTYPDPIGMTQERENAPGFWMSHVDAATSVMMQAQGVGAFVRARLPVHLFGGYMITYDLWLSVEPDALQYLSQIWDRPEYMSVVLEGVLANAIPPWGLLATPVRARVRDRRHTPYCDFSANNDLARVIANEWAHEDVLAALDDAGGSPHGHDHDHAH